MLYTGTIVNFSLSGLVSIQRFLLLMKKYGNMNSLKLFLPSSWYVDIEIISFGEKITFSSTRVSCGDPGSEIKC